jgi:hypothetical protein
MFSVFESVIPAEQKRKFNFEDRIDREKYVKKTTRNKTRKED